MQKVVTLKKSNIFISQDRLLQVGKKRKKFQGLAGLESKVHEEVGLERMMGVCRGKKPVSVSRSHRHKRVEGNVCLICIHNLTGRGDF